MKNADFIKKYIVLIVGSGLLIYNLFMVVFGKPCVRTFISNQPKFCSNSENILFLTLGFILILIWVLKNKQK